MMLFGPFDAGLLGVLAHNPTRDERGRVAEAISRANRRRDVVPGD